VLGKFVPIERFRAIVVAHSIIDVTSEPAPSVRRPV
jgi:hypothetical protein